MHDHHSGPFCIETDRLLIRPIEPAELSAFHDIARRHEIAENLASIPHPLSEEDAREWLAVRTFQGEPDFAAGIFKPDGTLIGCIGISSDPVTTYYFIAGEFWGHGYATEVLNPFLDWCVKEFGLAEIKVGVLDDNVGSQRVLEKSGFRNTHATLFQPPFRPEPDRLLMYWKGFGAPEPLTARTERLYIHPIHPGHSSRLSELSAESENFQLLGDLEAPFTAETAREWISEFLNKPEIYRFAVTRIDGLLTGASELVIEQNAGNIKMWIGSKYWNQDYANDAIRCLVRLIFDRMPQIERIICRVTRSNPVLIHSLDTIGFENMQAGSVQKATNNEQGSGGDFYLTRAAFEKASSLDKSNQR